MTSNLKKLRDDLKALILLAEIMFLDITAIHLDETAEIDEELRKGWKKTKGTFQRDYQKWYSESLSIMKQILPERLEEFTELYQPDRKRKEIIITTYRIQDYLMGLSPSGPRSFDHLAVVIMNFQTQKSILASLEKRFESSLFNITNILQADLHDTELDAARELLKNGYDRAAGIVAGVALEGHLKTVAQNHKLKEIKQNATISSLNDLLKNEGVIDVTSWRPIQRLGDLRNLCGHKRERDPTKEEVQELIDGVDKILKTVF